ncbi:CD320 antigen [Chlamydotis macqueenii]
MRPAGGNGNGNGEPGGRGRGRAGGRAASPLCPLAPRARPSLSLAGAPRAGSPLRGVRDPRAPFTAPPPPLFPPPPAASLSRCPPDRFQCEPGAACFPREWRCDGHPDCEDAGDERGCGTAEPSPDGAWLTPPRSPAVPPAASAETSAAPLPGSSVPSRSRGCLWILIVAPLLSVLVAVGAIAAWGLAKAKKGSDIFSLEKASREQLVPDKSQAGSLP